MKANVKNALLAAIGISVVLAALAACGNSTEPTVAAPTATPDLSPDASVSGSVTYREQLALSPGAKLVVELLDVSLQDAPSKLIAQQTISDPGQAPIEFNIEYNSDDIDPRNTYAVGASIIESDGRLAFINDTAYDVITRGNPDRVDMILVLVEPPPDLIEPGVDWRDWVEVPAQVISANLAPNEGERVLRIVYYQSAMEGCVRPGRQGVKVEGNIIRVTLTLMQPPATAWAIPCDEQMAEVEALEPLDASLEPGETYHVIVNDASTASFTMPRSGLGRSIIAESPVEIAEIMVLESWPPQYQLRVVSGLPKGSGCSQFNGYEIRQRESNEIEVVVTHHEIAADRLVACTADYPIVETMVPFGSDFESGKKYTVRVNSDITVSFQAQ